MLQSQAPVRPVCGFQRANARWTDSDSDSSVVSDRGCRPFTSCKVAPAVATLTSTSRSPSVAHGLSFMESGTETSVHYSTNPSTAGSLTSSPIFSLKRQVSNGIQFVCPKPKRGGSADSTKCKRWSSGTPPPKECTLNWSDSDEDGYETDEHGFDSCSDDDDLDDADSVLYRRLMRRHSSSVRGDPVPHVREDNEDDDQPAVFTQDL